MKALKINEKNFWNAYLESLAPDERPESPFVQADFAGTLEITDELLGLYLEGKKFAGSSLKEEFLVCNDPLPQIGNYWIVLNSRCEPKCILKTIKITDNKFKHVPKEVAEAEGEGDLSLNYWQQAHRAFYKPFLKEWGVENLDEATVITEYFKMVYK